MKLTKQDLNYELTHRHAGNGWAIVEMMSDNYCRVASVPFGKERARVQAFLACGDIMERSKKRIDPADKNSPEVEVMLGEDIVSKLNPIRNDIKRGKMKVVSSWITEVK